MKNKKGGTALVVIIALIVVMMIGLGVFMFGGFGQSTVGEQTKDLVAETKSGDVSSVGVYVRNLAHDDVNTKVAVATYCQDSDGQFIIDGTTSSTSTEITGKTTIGKTVTCWAFSSTYQTLKPAVVKVESEVEHIVIDAYQLTTDGSMDIYDDTLTIADNGVVNLTIASDTSNSYAKMRYKNNASDKFFPLGGFYFDTVENTNLSAIEMEGSVTLSGMDHSSAKLVVSDLATKVSTRKSKWDFVWEIDDDASKEGNQVLLLDENDYLETGAVTLTSDNSAGCGGNESITGYAFTKGYYRESKGTGVGYGHETDATTGAVISTDVTGATFYCADA